MNQPDNTTTIPAEQLRENLKISNDFMFAKVMRNPELCQGMVEWLLDIKIDHIEYSDEQKVIDIAEDSKSVRLDVYLKDDKNTVYDIEIQASSNKKLPSCKVGLFLFSLIIHICLCKQCNQEITY